MTSKQQGNIGVAEAISYFVKNGFVASLPLTDSQKYDIVIEKEHQLFRVQVKTTSTKSGRRYLVNLSVRGGTRGKCIQYNKNDFDLLYILCDNGLQYLIDMCDIDVTKDSLYLGDNYDKYILLPTRADWAGGSL
jgi:hypothetical protein